MNNYLDKRRRYFVTMIFIPLIFALFIYFLRNSLIDDFYIKSIVLDFTSGILFLLSVFGFLMLYLQTGFKKGPEVQGGVNNINPDIYANNVEIFRSELKSVNENLNNLKKQLKINQIELTEEKLGELQEIIKSKVINETTEDIIKEMEAKVEKNMLDERLHYLFQHTLARLRREVTSLNLRSNLNLVLGIIITGVGLYLLYLFVFKGELKNDNTLSFILHFAPKLSLVIFIEVFAFFFLSLYKTSLSEIKYYQNEMTKIETKYISLVTALELKSDDIISEILKDFSSNVGPNAQIGEIGGENGGNVENKLQQDKMKADNMVEIFGKILDVYKKG